MKNILESMKKIFFYSLPISVGSLLIHLFQSAEAVLIPAQLIISGNSYSTALETYGILSGMAMPLISLPSVFTGSLAVMLIPSVADKNASSDKTVKKTVTACLILGVFSVFVYGTFMADIASIMYDESRAGQYTKILSWLCPFMFLTQSMSSILNGAGKTTSTCVQNTLGIAIRLAALICLVPTYGINAYMISLLVSKLVVCIIQYVQIKHLFNLKINVGSQILKSAAYSGIATLSAYAAKMLLSALESSTNGIFSITADIIALGLSCAVFAALYFYFEKSKQTKSLLFP
jgi:stage V sporulation protein B